MGFRIQPKEVDIPEDDPFKNDRLGRKEPAEILTRILESIEGPCVLAVEVFVLAVNRSELAHSVCAIYGSDFDAPGYLRRFFDVDFRLPDADRRRFLEETLERAGLRGDNGDVIKYWLPAFFVASDLSLRRIAQSIHRLGLVFASLRSDRPSLAFAATMALVMRTLDRDLYSAFARGEVEERKALEFLRSHAPGLTPGHDVFLEAAIIVAALEIRNPRGYLETVQPSGLWKEYQAAAQKAEHSPGSNDETTQRAWAIVNEVRSICKGETLSNALGFTEAVQRIELLSSSLNGDDSESTDGGPAA